MSLLRLPNLKEIELQENENDMLVKVECLQAPPFVCPKCGDLNATFYKHGNNTIQVMDIPLSGKRVGIKIKRKRYKCRSCEGTFNEVVEGTHEKRKMTDRLVTYIEKQAVKSTFMEVSRNIGVDEGTIRNIFSEYVERAEGEIVFETPRILGIDEIHFNRKYRLILTNIHEKTIYDMVENRNKETVIARLSRIPNKHLIQIVTTDMWKPYKDAVNQVLPHAVLVIDKFHVIRMANEAFENCRKAIKGDMTQDTAKRLKGERLLLLKRYKDLDEKGLFKLHGWFDDFPDLREAYLLKELFYGIYDAPTRFEAEQLFEKWLERCLQFKYAHCFGAITSSVGNWHNEIFNYFDYRVTNALTESLNNLARKYDQAGRGYTFKMLRAKMMYNTNFHKVKVERFNYEGMLGMMRQPQKWNYGIDVSTLCDKWLAED